MYVCWSDTNNRYWKMSWVTYDRFSHFFFYYIGIHVCYICWQYQPFWIDSLFLTDKKVCSNSAHDWRRNIGYDIETKAQSFQWKRPEVPRPKKACQVRSNVKVFMNSSNLTCFFRSCFSWIHEAPRHYNRRKQWAKPSYLIELDMVFSVLALLESD